MQVIIQQSWCFVQVDQKNKHAIDNTKYNLIYRVFIMIYFTCGILSNFWWENVVP